MNSLLRRPMRLLAVVLLALGLGSALLSGCGSDNPPGAVHVSEMAQEIGPVSANFVNRALDRAERQDAAAWILMMDTPGGLISSTDDIVQRILAAEIPVIVFVSPAGARAASAGTFITMAAHVAVMAPNTQIGAAHPVAGGGEDIDGDLGDKVTNDAAADIRGIAKHRGRNEEWAEDAVRNSVSITGDEAVELNVIDFTASDLNDLLAQLDGQTVQLEPDGESVTLDIADAPVVETNYNFAESILDVIADPNIAFLFTSIGSLLLLIEAFSPGLVGPGGVRCDHADLRLLRPRSARHQPRRHRATRAGDHPAGRGGVRGWVRLPGDRRDHCAHSWRAVVDRRCVGRCGEGVNLGAGRGRGPGRTGRLRPGHADRGRPPPTQMATAPDLGRLRGHRRQDRFIAHNSLAPGGTVVVEAELWSARAAAGVEIVEGSTIKVIGMEGLTAIVESLEPPESGDE